MHSLTQDDLAQRAGVPIRTFKRFEAGECDSLAVMIRVALAMEQITGPGRLSSLERLFPGGLKDGASGTPLGALSQLAKTRERMLRKKRRRTARQSADDDGGEKQE